MIENLRGLHTSSDKWEGQFLKMPIMWECHNRSFKWGGTDINGETVDLKIGVSLSKTARSHFRCNPVIR